MIGAIIGDIVGSRFEWDNTKKEDFTFLHPICSFSDDSVMTMAVADAIMQWDGEGRKSFGRLSELAIIAMRTWGRRYPDAGYGGHFGRWLVDDSMVPYGSCGNGAAMRISPVGWAATSMEECIAMSRAVTEVTHDHPDGIKGAEATAVQIFLARQGTSLTDLKNYEEEHYYPIKYDVAWLRHNYRWHSLCDGTCQPAFECLYESTGYEDAIRKCMLVGGDCDTTGAICGGIAEAVWGIPEDIMLKARTFLDNNQLAVVDRFRKRYCISC